MLRSIFRMLRSSVRLLWQGNQATVQFERLAQGGALTSAQVDGYVNISDSPTVQVTRQWLCGQVVENLPARGAVLDAGCGSGYYLGEVARRRPDLRIYGVDISAPTLENYTRKLVPTADLAVGDFARQIPFEGQSFSLVYSITVLQYIHPLHLRRAVRNLVAALEPGGKLLVAMPTGVDWQDTWSMRDYYRHTAPALCSALEAAGLTITQRVYAPPEMTAGSRRDFVVIARRG